MTEVMTRDGAVATHPGGGVAKHLLPPLPYDYAALEPYIDARTMMLHHDKHHASYVEKLNTVLQPFPELREKTALWLLLNADKLPQEIRAAARNNAGGHVNHSLFWQAMSPVSNQGGGMPAGPLADAIKHDFGSFDLFKARFDKAGVTLFGSGWVWLARAQNDGGRLEVITTSGHDNPLMQGHFPLLLNDVWEHAYYLKHENRRADYLPAWWQVVNWQEAARRYERSDHSAEQRWDADGGHFLKAAG
jgi:superoxide dismutase, Fe-Mn family